MVVFVADTQKHKAGITPTTSPLQSGLASVVVTAVDFKFIVLNSPPYCTSFSY